MKNKLIAIGAASLISVSTLGAQDEWSLTTSLAIESSYMFRGVKLAEVTYMPGVDIAYGGFYAGLWAALPTDTSESNEVDIYAGYGFALSETMSLDVGATYYSYPSLADGIFEDPNTFEVYAGIAFDAPFSPALYVYYDFDLKNLTLEGSAGYSWELAENATFDVSGAVGFVAVDDGDDYSYGVATAGFGFQINEAASVSIYGAYTLASEKWTFNDGGADEIDDKEAWFGISVSAGF